MPATIDPRDLHRRHPLCPACGYDLVATTAQRKRICPECGEPFALDELNWERRRGDWTIFAALRMATKALALRALLGLAVATVCSALAIGLTNRNSPCILPFVVGLVEAWALGLVVSRRLFDDAGFDSVLLILAACLIAAAAVALGHLAAAEWIVTPRTRFAGLHLVLATAGAWGMILHQLVLERA